MNLLNVRFNNGLRLTNLRTRQTNVPSQVYRWRKPPEAHLARLDRMA